MKTSAMAYELDPSGIIQPCPQCGQKNRLSYGRLGQKFRCTNCHTDLAHPEQPIAVQDESAFSALIRQSALPVLVDFWAEWCGPCRMIAPELEKAAAGGVGKWIIAKVNTEELQELASEYGISAIPTMILFRGGQEVARHSGVIGAPALMRFIEGH